MLRKIVLEEIGPRDGFQNVKEFIPTETKLEIIDGLVRAGYTRIECSSFVSPKAIPQLADSKELVAACLERYPEVEWMVLVPNLRGAATAHELGIKEVCPVVSLSESHNKANINRSHAESMQGIYEIREQYPDLKINLDIATAFACPFEGMKGVDELLLFLRDYYEKLQIRSFTICDTIGKAHPGQVANTFKALRENYGDAIFGAHIHDTRNMGIVNSYMAMMNGADRLQSTLGGLGGCPFAPGASGNTASEDLVYALNQDGYDTGIDFEILLETAKYCYSRISGNYSGHQIHIAATGCTL